VLQALFVLGSESQVDVSRILARLNEFLLERTEGEKYATIFFCMLTEDGLLRWPTPAIALRFCCALQERWRRYRRPHAGGIGWRAQRLKWERRRCAAGDKIVAYTDGVSEARITPAPAYDLKPHEGCASASMRHRAAMVNASAGESVDASPEGAAQADDLTVVVIEYQPGG